MSSLFLVLLALKSAAFVAVPSKEINSALAFEFVGHLEEAFDFNGDKVVDPSEITHGILKHDVNNDAKMEKSEFDEYLSYHDKALLGISDVLFGLVDHNRDGAIDNEDLTRLYSAVDKNRSNKIEEEEFNGVLEELQNNNQTE